MTAVALRRQKQQRQMHAVVIACHATVRVRVKGQQWMALGPCCEASSSLQRQIQAEVITYNAKISACEQDQQWMAAVALLRKLLRSRYSKTRSHAMLL